MVLLNCVLKAPIMTAKSNRKQGMNQEYDDKKINNLEKRILQK